jgi:hypothetical protein
VIGWHLPGVSPATARPRDAARVARDPQRELGRQGLGLSVACGARGALGGREHQRARLDRRAGEAAPHGGFDLGVRQARRASLAREQAQREQRSERQHG